MPVECMDKQAVALRFDRSAASYDAHCRVQREMARRLVRRLTEPERPGSRILELGCGTGHLTRLLAFRFPGAQIDAVDLAPGMIEVARRSRALDQVRFLNADAEELDLEPASYALIVSSATVQWFAAAADTLRRLAGALEPGGRMVHATFGPSTFTELKELFAGLAREAGTEPGPVGLHLPGAGEWEKALDEGGLKEVGCRRESRILRYGSAAEFITELHATGATYRPGVLLEAGPARRLKILGRALSRYDTQYASAQGVPVTYELLEMYGRRPGPGKNHLSGLP